MGSDQQPDNSTVASNGNLDAASPAGSKTLWGGRFQEPTDAFVERFTASVQFDQRLYSQDIQGSIAHATMLASVDVLTADEAKQIIDGLNAIALDIESGNFNWSIAREDVHMNIEAALTERIGSVGKKSAHGALS